MTMFGLDTNVVVRLLTNDDPQQRRKAVGFVERLGPDHVTFVSLVAVIELDWALRSKLGFSRVDTITAISRLLQSRGLAFEHHDLILTALDLVLSKNADFADALIACRSLEVGCQAIKTFDKKAASRVPGMELLA